MKVNQYLTRGVEKIYPTPMFLKKLLKGKTPLVMYLGIDPTGPSLHLGHAIILRKLRQWQELGHKVILLIGDFTGMIGDPTNKSATRPRLTREEVLTNARFYKSQASKILRFDGKNPAALRYNSRWLAPLTFAEVVELAAHFTHQQLIARDMFQRRLAAGKPIFEHEFLYPLMQAYDSVAMRVDGEIGGNDQTFNMLCGRTLMQEMLGKEKFVITMKLLIDPSGKKMGKSEGNMVTLADSAEEMFGKVMSWTDGMIRPGFELLTDVDLSAIDRELMSGRQRMAKMRLASTLVAYFHGRPAAAQAQEKFIATFQQHKVPAEAPRLILKSPTNILDVLVKSGLAKSKSEARQLIMGGGVKVAGEVVRNYEAMVIPTTAGVLLKKGKRYFVRVCT